MKKYWTLLFRIGFCGLLFYFLSQRGLISSEIFQRLWEQPKVFGGIFILFLGVSSLSIFRWYLLIRGLAPLTFQGIGEIAWIGNFFNLALPGAVSGDFFKAIALGRFAESKALKVQKTQIFGSLLLDRLLGLSACVLLSGSAFFLEASHQALPWMIRGSLGLAVLGVFLFLAHLFWVRSDRDPLLKLLILIEKKLKTQKLTQLYQGIVEDAASPKKIQKILIGLAISLGIHMAVIWACFELSFLLDPQHPVSFFSFLLMIPLGILMTSLPIGPAGLGSGNLAFLFFLNLVGFSKGADLFSCVAFFNLLVGSIGALLFFISPHRHFFSFRTPKTLRSTPI